MTLGRSPTFKTILMKLAPIYCAVAVGLAASEVGRAQFFDFNDGNAGGLTEYNPLTAVGMPGTYSFSDGTVRLQHSGVPEAMAGIVGPGRLGYVNSTSVSNFSSSVEIVAWQESGNQFGLAARVSEVGLGTSDGYGLFYSINTGTLLFNRLTNEAGTLIGTQATFNLEAGNTYRLLFTGEGSTLTGTMQQKAGEDLFFDIAQITAEDATYASGISGVLALACACDPTSAVDVTFDNLFLAVPEPEEYAAAMALGLVGFALYRRRRTN
jgi:hypothetical protein